MAVSLGAGTVLLVTAADMSFAGVNEIAAGSALLSGAFLDSALERVRVPFSFFASLGNSGGSAPTSIESGRSESDSMSGCNSGLSGFASSGNLGEAAGRTIPGRNTFDDFGNAVIEVIGYLPISDLDWLMLEFAIFK